MGQEMRDKKEQSKLMMAALQELPNDMFLLARVGDTAKHAQVIPLDEYPDMDARTKLYLDAIRKYGEDNVRLCRVLTATVHRTVEFVE